MRSLKRLLYRLGARPRVGSVWYSTSLSRLYTSQDYLKAYYATDTARHPAGPRHWSGK